MTQCSMNTRSFIFFTRILARAQISSLTSEGFFIEVLSVTILETTKNQSQKTQKTTGFYRSQFWRLQKLQMVSANYTIKVRRVWDKSLALNIKSEQNELSDTQNSVLFAFLSNLSIFKIYNKEFLKSKSFCPRLCLQDLSESPHFTK